MVSYTPTTGIPARCAAARNEAVSESVTCWLYRNTLTLCPENSPFWSETYCGAGSTPFMTSAWKAKGVRLRVPAAWSGYSQTGSVVATGVPGYRTLNAAIRRYQGCRDRSNAAARAVKYARWAGWRAARSAATAFATAGMVVGLYHRCGLGVLSGRPSRCCTSTTLRPEFGAAASILFMYVS